MIIAADKRSDHVMHMINQGYKMVTRAEMPQGVTEVDTHHPGDYHSFLGSGQNSFKFYVPTHIDEVSLVRSSTEGHELILWTKTKLSNG